MEHRTGLEGAREAGRGTGHIAQAAAVRKERDQEEDQGEHRSHPVAGSLDSSAGQGAAESGLVVHKVAEAEDSRLVVADKASLCTCQPWAWSLLELRTLSVLKEWEKAAMRNA